MRLDRSRDQLGEVIAEHIFSWEDFYVEFQCSCGRFAMSGSRQDARQAWGKHLGEEIRKHFVTFVRAHPARPTQKWTWTPTGSRLWISPDRKGVEIEGLDVRGATFFSYRYATWLVEALGSALETIRTVDRE